MRYNLYLIYTENTLKLYGLYLKKRMHIHQPRETKICIFSFKNSLVLIMKFTSLGWTKVIKVSNSCIHLNKLPISTKRIYGFSSKKIFKIKWWIHSIEILNLLRWSTLRSWGILLLIKNWRLLSITSCTYYLDFETLTFIMQR